MTIVEGIIARQISEVRNAIATERAIGAISNCEVVAEITWRYREQLEVEVSIQIVIPSTKEEG